MIQVILCVFILLFSLLCNADNILDKVLDNSGGEQLKQTINTFVDTAKQTWSGASGMLEGMGQGFGIVTKDYHYSYRVFNDAPAPILVAEERITGIMGTNFSGEIKKSVVLLPNRETGNEFYNRQLYISVWICADNGVKDIQRYAKSSQEWAKYGLAAGAPLIATGVGAPLGIFAAALGAGLAALAGSIATVTTLKKYQLYEKDIYPWSKNDDNVYYYRAYTYKGKLHAEALDLKGTTPDFSGQFYNNTQESIALSFIKDDVTYNVILEPGTFNLLESSKKNYSIRPPAGKERGFQFYKGEVDEKNKIAYLPLAPEGIGYVTNDSKDPAKPHFVVSGPMLYTYEIHASDQSDLTVSMQGLSIGNFDQPSSTKIRDINPLECHIWYKSSAQVQEIAKKNKQEQDNAAIPFDLPESVWIAYSVKDYQYRKKINPGQIMDFTLLRPLLSQKEATLFVVSLQTSDDTKANKFLDRLVQGIIGKDALKTIDLASFDQNTLLTDMKPNPHGMIDDTKSDGSGIKGSLILVDTFLPQGLGHGPFYYTIEPPVLRIDQFANSMWFDNDFYTVDSKTKATVLKPEVMQELAIKLPAWITLYSTDQKQVEDQLKAYIQEKGNKGLFVDATQAAANRVLTKQGVGLYQTLLKGPISIEHCPIVRKAGMNYYIFSWGQQPEDWPSSSAQSTPSTDSTQKSS